MANVFSHVWGATTMSEGPWQNTKSLYSWDYIEVMFKVLPQWIPSLDITVSVNVMVIKL